MLGFVSPSVDQTAVSPNRSQRVIELDALRGIGALMILGFHLWPATCFFGWTRVDLFFVLSGYLITTIALKFGADHRLLFTFWYQRALRILPAYFVLVSLLCVALIVQGKPPRLDALAAYLTLMQDMPRYWSGNVPLLSGSVVHMWSLAIEVQFYVVWPLIIVLAGRRLLLPIAVWFILSSVVARLLGMSPAIALARCDGLALGAILALILSDPERPSRRPWWLGATLIAVGLITTLLLVSGPSTQIETPITGIPGCSPLSIFAINVIYTCVVGLTICHAGHRVLSPLRGFSLCYLGRISYGIYLYHLLIMEAVTRLIGHWTVAIDFVTILASVLLAAISWEFLERPLVNISKQNYDRSNLQHTSTGSLRETASRSATSLATRYRRWLPIGMILLLGGAVALAFGVGLPSATRRGFLDRVYRDSQGGVSKYVLFVPNNYRVNIPCPLILFLHGAGATGTDGRKPLAAGLGPAISRREASFPFFVLFPQSRVGSWASDTPDVRRVLEILDDVQKSYNIDPDRIYLTGMSLGGHGTWSLAAADPQRWAAIVPVCGWGNPRLVDGLSSLPCWCFHGESDRVVPVSGTRSMVDALRAAGGSPIYTEYPGVGHNCWDQAYELPELYQWLQRQRRRGEYRRASVDGLNPPPDEGR